MSLFMRGALVEYKSDFLGPVPNIVIFQFNPESLSRTINIPNRSLSRTSGSKSRENYQAGDMPYERISLTAHFSAADLLNIAFPTTVQYGIGPQLAALEKMVLPVDRNATSTTASAANNVDAAGNAVSGGSGNKSATQSTPRRQYPNILFIWGATRVLPVIIESMTINEQQFDARLNPIQAEVSLGLSVLTVDLPDEDRIAKGAAEYSNKIKDIQAAANLANAAAQPVMDVLETISF